MLYFLFFLFFPVFFVSWIFEIPEPVYRDVENKGSLLLVLDHVGKLPEIFLLEFAKTKMFINPNTETNHIQVEQNEYC